MENKQTTSNKTVLVVGVSTAFITSFASSALTLSVPTMGVYFHLGATSVGWIVSIYTLIVAGFSVPMGKLADSTNRKKMLVAGTFVFMITSFLAVFATTGAIIIGLRAIQSIGAAMIFGSNMPIAISAYPPQRRGYVIGIVTSGTYIGLSAGPVLGGILNNYWGWKSIFILIGIVSLWAFIASVFGIDGHQEKTTGYKQDIAGNITYLVMITAIIYGLTNLNSLSYAWMILAGGLLLGVIYVCIELRATNPMMDVRIFAGNLTFTLSNLTALLQYSATFALSYVLSIYLQVVMGYSSQVAGIILIAHPFFMAVLSPRVGRLSDKVPAYKLASAGVGICGLGLLFFGFVTVNTPLVLVIIALCIAGIGTALFSSPNTNVVMGCVPPAKYGVTNSLLSAVRTTGQSFSMAIITLVTAAIVGNVSLYEVAPADLLRTMHITFFIFAGFSLAGCIMSLQRKRVK